MPGRKDWYYVPLPIEMVEILDRIVKEEGRKYGIMDKAGLVRILLGDFVEKYEKYKKNFVLARIKFREYNNKKKGGGDGDLISSSSSTTMTMPFVL